MRIKDIMGKEKKIPILRDYQQKIVDETRAAILSGKKKILVVSPTGSGKSFIISEIFRLAVEKGKKCLFIVHRRNLVMQIKETMKKFGLNASVIMAGEESNFDCSVQLATQQTLSRRLDLDDISRNRFFVDADLVMCDEAHHSISQGYRKIFDLYKDKIILIYF